MRTPLHALVGRLRRSELLQSSAGIFGVRLVSSAVGFANAALAARLLGVTEFGIYSLAIGAANLGVTVALLGLPDFVVREVAANITTSAWGYLKALIARLRRVILQASLIVGLAYVTAYSAGLVHTSFTFRLAVAVAALIPLLAMLHFHAALVRGLGHVVLSTVSGQSLRPLIFLTLLLTAPVFIDQPSALHAVTLQGLAICVGLLTAVSLYVSRRPPELSTARSHGSTPKWHSEASPFFWLSVITAATGYASLYFVGSLAGTAQAGLFQAAAALTGLVQLGLTAVKGAIQPRLAAAWPSRNIVRLQELATQGALLSSIVAASGGLLLLPFAETVLKIYSTEYVAGANTLRILVVAQLVSGICGPCGNVLMMTGYQRLAVQAIIVAGTVSITTALIAIPALGLIGGAIASAAGTITWNLLFTAIAWKKLNINTTLWAWVRK